MIAVVSAFDLSTISNSVSSVEVWSQHLDPVGKGSHTGWLEPDLALYHGAVGPIINHAEDECLKCDGVMHMGTVSTNLGLPSSPGITESSW